MADLFTAKRAALLRARLLRQSRLFHHQSVLGHLWDAWSSTPLYSRWQSFLTYFRRVRLVAYLLRLSLLLLTALEAGVLAVIATVLLLFLAPPVLLFTIGVTLALLVEAPRRNRRFRQETAQKRIYVLFLTESGGTFFKANARSLAARKNTVVLIVSPYWISPRGIAGKGFFCTARRECENVYLVRRYYYFSLKRSVLDKRETAYLY